MSHFATECRKVGSSKSSSKALTSKKKDWDSDKEINFVYMKNIEKETTTPTGKVPEVVYTLIVNNMPELKSFLKSFH